MKDYIVKLIRSCANRVVSGGAAARDYSYPMKLPGDRDRVKISFPQADSDYRPALFAPTEIWRVGSRAGYRHIKNAFTVLYATLEDMGCPVNRTPVEQADIVLRWSTKHMPKSGERAPLILEHGWLPRFSYQLSDSGSNAQSHVAKAYQHVDLSADQRRTVLAFVERMRLIFQRGVQVDAHLPINEPFVLVAFQLATDFNLRFSNSLFSRFYSEDAGANIKFSQAIVDHVEAANLPYRVVYKQHPSDRSDLRKNLRIAASGSLLVANDDSASTHDLFASGLCRLVVSVNSNTLHEGLVWGIPALALGTLIWDEDCDIRPLPKDLVEGAVQAGISVMEDPRCLSYLWHLMKNQWYLSDFQNPLMVTEIIRTHGRCEPYRLRTELGLPN